MSAQEELAVKLSELGADPGGFVNLSVALAGYAQQLGHSPATLIAAAQLCIEITRCAETVAGTTDSIISAVHAGFCAFGASRDKSSS